MLFLQTPIVQNWVLNKALSTLNEKTGKNIEAGSIRISWLDAVTLKDLKVFDYEGNLMIAAKSLKVDYSLTELLGNNKLIIDEIELNGGELHMVKYLDSLNLNFVEWLRSGPPKAATNEPKEPMEIELGHLIVNSMEFSYNNMLKDSIPMPQFDYGHFSIQLENVVVDEFLFNPDTIVAKITNFSLSDSYSGFKIDLMKGDFLLSSGSLLLKEFELATPYSELKDEVSLYFSEVSDIGSFVEKVSFNVHLDNCRIAPEDLIFFTPSIPDSRPLLVSATVYGSVGDLIVNDLSVGMGQTLLLGKAYLLGLPKVEETFIDLEVREGVIFPKDIKPFVGELSENIRQLGSVRFSGQFSGFIHDFVANATFNTDQGYVASDLNLKIPQDWREMQYSGKLILKDFNLGKFFKNRTLVQTINFDGKVKGRGLTTKNADFDINATLINSGIYGHVYERIGANGHFASEFFDGKLTVKDTAFTVESKGNIDLKNYPEHIKFSADIKNIDFRALNFTDEDLNLRAKVDIVVSGLNFDSLNSDIKLYDIAVDFREKELKLDTIRLVTSNKNNLRHARIEIPEFSAEIKGDFLYSLLIRDFRQLTGDLIEYFQVLKPATESTPKSYGFSKYQIDFDMEYRNLSKYLDFLPFELFVSPNGTVSGSYYQRENASLSFYADVDSVYYDGIGFKSNTVEVNLSKKLDSLSILGIFYVSSNRQIWRSIPQTEKLEVEALWMDRRIEVSTKIKQPSTKSSADLNMNFTIEPDLLACQIDRSRLSVLGENWTFDPENRIEFQDNTLSIFNLSLQNQFQSIAISGLYSDSLFTDMRISMKEFDMASLSLIIPTKIAGTLDGDFEILKLEDENTHQLNSKIDILNLRIDDYYVGNLIGHTEWHPEKRGLYLDFKIERKAINTIRLSGFYLPEDTENQLNLTAQFEEANLGIAASFFDGLFSDLKGMASGEVKITGHLASPTLAGKTSIRNGSFKFDYLGIPVAFNGNIGLDDHSIRFSDFILKDQEGNAGTLSGFISHENFKNLKTNFTLGFNKMMILNTTSKSGESYYGTAYGSGTLQIKGPFEDLNISAKIKSNAGTKIYIPLESAGEIEQKDYITFVNLSDTTKSFSVDQVIEKSTSGISLDFSMEVTPDAYVELIFDIRSGDIIRGRADGNIDLRLNSDGQFEMFGDVSITEGAYNFTIPSVAFNKEFNVQPGSTISWYGDPYAGVVNLHATYRQMADLSDIRSTQEDQVSNRLPFLVILDLKGEMLSPAIGFQIKLDDTQASVSTEEQALINAININEQELKRQVFGLLILRKFLPENNFVVSSSDLSGSISEFLSNQFSYFISQVDENLEVDVDLASMDQNAFNTFQLRLSYTFLNGRLKVTGGGGLSQAPSTDSESSSFMGDWSLRYLLTKDGHFRIKAFSHTDNVAGTLKRETGVSFQYIKSFDDLQELLARTRDEAIKSKQESQSKPGA